MAFRKSISQEELRRTLTPNQRREHETTYAASRGGWVKTKDKPVPGKPKKND